MQNERVLGIDYGTVRIGLSLSDPLGIIAQPFQTLSNDRSLWEDLRAVIADQHVTLIVVGMPLNLKGQQGEIALEVEKFIERLKKETSAGVVTWDERFTSSIAHQTLLDMGTKKSERRKNKGRVDSMAAAVMLQSFLDSTKRSMSC
jgi:putative Holliday junction resolvase